MADRTEINISGFLVIIVVGVICFAAYQIVAVIYGCP